MYRAAVGVTFTTFVACSSSTKTEGRPCTPGQAETCTLAGCASGERPESSAQARLSVLCSFELSDSAANYPRVSELFDASLESWKQEG